jgi:HNH endonuclease
MTTCIYCRNSSAKRFPREHLVPKAFGRFTDNLTLDCVCGPCNSFFDRELELFLTRDTVEAILRVRYGLRTKSGRRKLGSSRLVVRVISSGDWYGARIGVERNATGTALTGEPLPQVAFRKSGEAEWRWFLEEELDQTKDWERYRTNAETKIVGKPDGAVQHLMDRLVQLGIVFKKRGTFEKHGGQAEVFAEAILDDIILRGVAKIALNLLAHLKGADFALRSDFDPIRNFIRRGAKPRQTPVIVTRFPILRGDDAFYRQTNGHLVVLDWDEANLGIVCLVSLFNHLTYHVVLCPAYSGIWHPLSGGRHFDLQTLTISEVRGI